MWRDRGALRGGSSVRVTTAIRGLASYPYRMPYRPPPRAPYMYAVTPPPGPGPGAARFPSRPRPIRPIQVTGQRDSPTYVLLYVNSYY